MTFTPEITEQLKRKLDPIHVHKRDAGGGIKLDYLESWFVISEANRIFGFDGWSSETVLLEPVGDVVQQQGNNGRPRFKAGYRAIVRVTVGDVVRMGTGFGNGIGPDPVDVHELAVKEAESDARKRALSSFGNPFGLALYDKKRANVMTDADKQEEAQQEIDRLKSFVDDFVKTLDNIQTMDALNDLLQSVSAEMQDLAQVLPKWHSSLWDKKINPLKLQIEQLKG